MIINFLRRMDRQALKQVWLLNTVAIVGLLLGVIFPIFLDHVFSCHNDNHAVFGPKKFERDRGRPETESVRFSVDKEGMYTLLLVNGEDAGDRDGKRHWEKERHGDMERHRDSEVTSAKVTLLGVEVIGPSDFHDHLRVIERTVTLKKHNVLSVKLEGRPGSYITITITCASQNVNVPKVVGMTQADAQTAITAAGLAVGTVSTESSSTVPAGSVISQNPAAGTSVTQGSSVNLDVSTGPPTVSVPNVVGLIQADAETAITSASLVVGAIAAAPSVTVPAGSVISQDPASGTIAVLGTSVNLVISNGPPTVSVPNVVGLSQTDAQTAITSANLLVGPVTGVASNTVSSGTIIGQNPATGTSINIGSFVSLIVSTGPPPLTVPDVTGLTQQAAKDALVTKGLTLGTVTSANSATVTVGNVISQDPAAGTSITQGAAVSIVVSLGPATGSKVVPKVIGMHQSNASSSITAAGLTTGVIGSDYSSSIPSGSVISQYPLAAANVPAGSAVNLVVSLGPITAPLVPPDPKTIAQPVDLSVATTVVTGASFLFNGSDPVQTGVPAGAIESQRAAVVRGLVTDRDNLPIPGVNITVKDHPEFGQTFTQANGMFDLVVNGGGLITISYRKSGYLPAQRQLSAPWDGYINADDIILIPLDPQVTELTLTGSTPVQVVRGSVMTDDDGTRQATLLVPQGTLATMVMPDGSTQPITTLNVRATEYTVGANGPQAMPATLPPTSAYTYAVELSVDEAISAGAEGINFDRPVYSYVENFLDFPVGGTVPAGYYDPKKAAWIPSANGRIIKLLAVNAGLADLDTDGSGLAADATKLAALGITNAEREQLATLYAPGQSFWRVPITHFSPWDYNYPLFGPPSDATSPSQPLPDNAWEPIDKPCTQKGSIIECQNQILGESTEIPGTPFTLNYRSNRVSGWGSKKLTIPVSGNSVPASLKSITLDIQVAGKRIVEILPAAANQKYDFIWDGTDVYGREINGVQKVRISIGYTYGIVLYSTPALFENAFAMVGLNSSIGIPRTGSLFTLWQKHELTIGNWTSKPTGLGAWLLDVHHAYDPAGGIMNMGDGSSRKVQWQSGSDGIISTVAGNGTCAQGNDGPAAGASIRASDLDLGVDSSIFFQEPFRTRKISTDGIITTIAGHVGPENTVGSLYCGTISGDGGPAIDANITCAYWFTVAPDNSIYMNNIQRPNQNFPATGAMRRIGPDGIINPLVAGSVYGYISSAPNGDLFFDTITKIYRMSPDGKVSHFAGNGNSVFNGDSIPATTASFRSGSKHLAFGHDGSVYIADIGDYNKPRIRRVSPDGIITTVAGSGKYTLSPDFAPLGDGGPAIFASFALINNNHVPIAVGPDDSIFIGDYYNNRIRRVGTDGIITTVVGNGQYGYNGDNIPAKSASLSNVLDIAVSPDGSIYFIDGSCRIRKVTFLAGGYSDEYYVAAEDNSEIYVFDGAGRHLRTVNSLTNAVLYRFGYDANGRLASVTNGDGNMTTIERDYSGNPTAILAPFGQRTLLTVNSDGYLNSIANPAGETSRMTYTTEGLITSYTKPNGKVSYFQYDNMGLLTRDENAAGGFSALDSTRNNYTSLVTLTTALGRSTTYLTENLINGDQRRTITLPTGANVLDYIGVNGVTQTTLADNTAVTVTKSPDPRFGMQSPVTTNVITLPSGLASTRALSRAVNLAIPNNPMSLVGQTDTLIINGRNYTSVYDNSLKQLTTTTPVGRQIVSLLDNQGRTVSFAPAPGLTPLTASYYSYGKLHQVVQGNMRTTFSYDLLGRLFSQTDALSQTARYGYDNADRVTQLTLPSGRAYGFAYDANGNRTQITMPSGAVHKLGYTVIDLESDYTPPANLPYAWQFNLDQEWTRTILPGGRTVDASYDTGGRPTGIVYPEASVGILYNDLTERVNSLTRTSAFSGTSQQIVYTYDGSLVTGSTFSGVANGAFTFTYDNNFFLRQIDFVSGSNTVTTPITRDADGLVTGYGPFAFTRGGPAGAVSGISDTASNIAVTYDTLGRVATRTHTVNGLSVYSIQLSYDSTGNISRKIETVSGVQTTWDYTYDADGQLIRTKKNGADQEVFAYDVNGNRTSYQRPNSWTTTSEYDNQDRIVWQGGVAYQLNADGQLTQRGADTFQYSAMGELLHATANGQTVTYSYDGMGRRVARSDSTGTSQYLYGNLKQPFQFTAMRDPAGVLSYYYYDDTGKLFAFDKGGTRYYVATDQVGTPKVVSDAAGNAVKFLEFDSFGMWTFDSNPDLDIPVGYAGGIVDKQTTLVRFGYRDYEPWSGRWTAKDPIFFKGGQGNLFGYVQNNPINLIDPLGLERWHPPDGNHTVGRPGTIVPPGGGVGTLIEKRVGSGWEFGKKHDEFVGKATQCGIPDLIINIPSMLPVYLYSIAKDLSEMPAESKPGYFPLLEMRF